MSLRITRAAMICLGLLAGRLAFAQPAEPYAQKAGPHEVATQTYEWHDAARDRDVPVRIYWPKDAQGASAVIVFSHGLGGSRDGYAYLGRHWASYGYVVVHPQHIGSDTAVWQGAPAKAMEAMSRAANDPNNAINRPKDITFVLDQLESLNKADATFKGKLDLSRVGVGGHSFGAYTTLASVGQSFPVGKASPMLDARIKAAVPMSAPAGRGDAARAFGNIKVPCLHMTGTLDDSPIGDTKADQRRIPYDSIGQAEQYLITFTGGDHMIFSGRGRAGGVLAGRGKGEKDAVFQSLICQSSTAFWDAYLKDDAKAKAWLADGAFKRVLGEDGTFESKGPAQKR